MEHYILCASIFMCIALHFVCQAALVRRDPTKLKNSVCSPVVTKELRAFDPPYVLTVFLFAGLDLSGMYYQFIWPWAKVSYMHFIRIYVHYMFMNATSYIRLFLSIN